MGFLTAEKIEDLETNRPGGGYFRTKEIPDNGKVRVRFLGDAITGVGGWRDGKPLRFEVRPEDFDITTLDVNKIDNKPGKLTDFIATVLWNYKTETLQIFEITQRTIQDKCIALQRNESWGDITHYDIEITKKVGARVDYEVTALPDGKGKTDKAIMKAFDETFIDLTQLYSNGDPFKPGE